VVGGRVVVVGFGFVVVALVAALAGWPLGKSRSMPTADRIVRAAIVRSLRRPDGACVLSAVILISPQPQRLPARPFSRRRGNQEVKLGVMGGDSRRCDPTHALPAPLPRRGPPTPNSDNTGYLEVLQGIWVLYLRSLVARVAPPRRRCSPDPKRCPRSHARSDGSWPGFGELSKPGCGFGDRRSRASPPGSRLSALSQAVAKRKR